MTTLHPDPQLKNTLQNLLITTLKNTKSTYSYQQSPQNINRSFLPSTAKIFTAPWAITLTPIFERQYQSITILKTYNHSRIELSFIGEGNNSIQAARHYHRFIASFSWKKRQFFRDYCKHLTVSEKTNLAKEVIFQQRAIICNDELLLLIREKRNILSYIKLHSLEENIVNTVYKPLLI